MDQITIVKKDYLFAHDESPIVLFNFLLHMKGVDVYDVHEELN